MKYKKKIITIPGKMGKIEAQISIGNPVNKLGIVVSHPHPQYGGTMANNVSGTIFKSFAEFGYFSIRFNFRGVGNSDGTYSEGFGEREDIISVCNFLFSEYSNVKKIMLIGYSFGAAISSSIVDELEEIVGYVAVSFPLILDEYFILKAQSRKRKFFLLGDRDDFTSVLNFEREYSKMPQPKKLMIFPNVDHFWFGKENDLAKIIVDWTKKIKI